MNTVDADYLYSCSQIRKVENVYISGLPAGTLTSILPAPPSGWKYRILGFWANNRHGKMEICSAGKHLRANSQSDDTNGPGPSEGKSVFTGGWPINPWGWFETDEEVFALDEGVDPSEGTGIMHYIRVPV